MKGYTDTDPALHNNNAAMLLKPSSDLALSISNLTFSYPGQHILLNINRLAVSPSTIVSVLGPSGCGKTTLMLLIAGLLTPSSGDISAFGQAPSRIRESGSMAVVFQSSNLLPWRTVLANLALPFELRGLPVDNQRLKEALGLVGLSGLEAAYIDELSGGMQSRVAIARALVTHPALLLMDEPFGNLDESNRLRLNLAIAEIQRELGMTVFFITHNINEAILISDRIFVMNQLTTSDHLHTEILDDITIDFPNKTVESISSPQFQGLYQSVLQHFHQGISR